MESIKHLVKMNEAHAKEGLYSIAVNTDVKEDWKSAMEFMEKKVKPNYTNVFLNESQDFVEEKLGLTAFTGVFVFNRRGQWIRFQESGEENRKKIDSVIKKFLAEK